MKSMPQDNPFMGLFKENGNAGNPLGPVNKAILVDQFHRVLFGSQGKWWGNSRGAIAGLEREIQFTTFGRILNANLEGRFKGNVFST
jgi:hypothetical protein